MIRNSVPWFLHGSFSVSNTLQVVGVVDWGCPVVVLSITSKVMFEESMVWRVLQYHSVVEGLLGCREIWREVVRYRYICYLGYVTTPSCIEYIIAALTVY